MVPGASQELTVDPLVELASNMHLVLAGCLKKKGRDGECCHTSYSSTLDIWLQLRGVKPGGPQFKWSVALQGGDCTE